MRTRFYLVISIALFFCGIKPACCQQNNGSTQSNHEKTDSVYITRLDTLLHLQSWISAHVLEYKFVYNKDFRLLLSPQQINNLSFGFSYRYLDLGFSFSPDFLNTGQDKAEKGKSDQFSFGTGFSIHRFKLNIDLSSVKGFYLKNSNEFHRGALPDSPFVVYPDLRVGYFSVMVRYNANKNFSTAALAGGTQIQRRSAWTVLPSFQFATYTFHNDHGTQGVQNESTHSTDLNVLLPIVGTFVSSPKFSASLGLGPSFGVDFFKSIALDDSNRVAVTKGTKPTTGASLQMALNYHTDKFFAGFEFRYRSYGHKIEDVSRLIKQYSYFQLFVGWRVKAPRFAKKALDWVNEKSPIDFD